MKLGPIQFHHKGQRYLCRSVTWYCGSSVSRLSSLNSSWMLVTSATVLSEVQRGGCAVPFPMFTSEYGILDGVLKAGINLEPMSFCKEGLFIIGRQLKLKSTIMTRYFCKPMMAFRLSNECADLQLCQGTGCLQSDGTCSADHPECEWCFQTGWHPHSCWK